MAKIRKQRKSGNSQESGARASLTQQSEGQGTFDLAANIFLFLLLAGVILISPFLYSRYTTENFLTPKEFTSKIWMGLLSSLFFIYLLIRHFSGGKVELCKTRLDLPIFIFFALCVASLAWNYNIPSGIRDIRGTFLILLLFPLIVNIVWYQWQLDTILWVIAFAGIATATLGIMESYNLYFRYDPMRGIVFARDEIFAGQIYDAFYLPLFPQLASKNYDITSIVSTFGNRNYLGTFTMFTAFIPLAFYFYYRNSIMKAVSMGLFGWMIFGMYISRCRAALLGLVCGFIFMSIALFLFDKGWKFIRRNAIFFSLAILIPLSIFCFSVFTTKKTSVSFLDKLKTTFTMDRQASNVFERVWVWYGTFESFAHSPVKWVIGSGYGAFKHFFPLQEAASFDDDNKETFAAVTFRQAHNDWLQLVSELGLIGLGVFLFICWRFFGGIFSAIRKDMDLSENPEIKGEHVLLVALGAAMVSQMIAAVPDFPFHRIETALYAVVVLALVPLLGETEFFQKPLPKTVINETAFLFTFLGLSIVTGFNAAGFEMKCWQADTLVRKAESLISGRSTPQMVDEAKQALQRAIEIDPLPGDPYLKLSSIYEIEGKTDDAVEYTERSWKNINFNARSTYHSVVFRQMHIAYHLLHDHYKALQYALKGQYLTAGEARSIYYFYLGKVALEAKELPIAEWALKRSLNYPSFKQQAASNLAVCYATEQRWSEAYDFTASLSESLGDQDPTLLDIVGISGANLKKFPEAEKALRKAIELNPSQPVYKRDLGWTLLKMSKISDAKKILEDAAEMTTIPEGIKAEVVGMLASVSSGLLNQGKTLQNNGKKDEAMAYFQSVATSKFTSPKEKTEAEKEIGGIVGVSNSATKTQTQTSLQGSHSSVSPAIISGNPTSPSTSSVSPTEKASTASGS
ncbi:MAG: O-antigen ligase family protein [Candidatus Riflebacteria bacterium]|nr:O-antigen ligase family protein [Candidatus Riflebacteria bacterium]